MRQREREAGRGAQAGTLPGLGAALPHLAPPHPRASLASEDQKFFGHEGVDWEAMQEVAQKNREKGRFARGGSTITQQLAKNLFFTTRQEPVRKVRELSSRAGWRAT